LVTSNAEQAKSKADTKRVALFDWVLFRVFEHHFAIIFTTHPAHSTANMPGPF
jgi:hypothetical protein